jgi:hypothetical protein
MINEIKLVNSNMIMHYKESIMNAETVDEALKMVDYVKRNTNFTTYFVKNGKIYYLTQIEVVV